MKRLHDLLHAVERSFLGFFSALAGGPLLGLELFPNSVLWLGGWLYWGILCLVLARGIKALGGRSRSRGDFLLLMGECSCGLFLILIGFLVARVENQPAWLLLSGLGPLWFWMCLRERQPE